MVFCYSSPIRLRQCPQKLLGEASFSRDHLKHREQACGCQGGELVGEGWSGSLGLADANYYIQNG